MISIAPRSFSWCYTEFGGQGDFLGPVDSPVPCLVLHRAWAGAVCGHHLYLSWCYTELGQGRCILVMIIEEVGGLELGVLGFGLIHIGFRVSGCL